MGTKLIIEIFNLAEAAKDPIQVLEANRNHYLDQFIDIMKAGVDWDLPEGDPPFKTQRDLPIGNTDMSLYNVLRRFYLFEKKTQVNQIKREMVFIQMLESIHHTEAQLVLDLKNGKIPYKYPRLWKAVGGRPVPPREVKKEPVVEEKTIAELALEPMEKPEKVKAKKAAYNNGTETKMFVPGEEPEGWIKGRLKK